MDATQESKFNSASVASKVYVKMVQVLISWLQSLLKHEQTLPVRLIIVYTKTQKCKIYAFPN
jgi:hypothetical protein